MDTFTQVSKLFFFIVTAIVTVEVSLYWFLTQYKKLWYWPGSLGMAAAVGALIGGWGNPSYDWVLGGYASSFVVMTSAGFKYGIRGRHRLPMMMMAPAFIAICLLIVYPFFFELNLAFHKLNMYTINKWMHGGSLKFVGFQNFIAVFTSSPLQTATFWDLLLRTILWTSINLIFHILGGLGLALLLNRIGSSRSDKPRSPGGIQGIFRIGNMQGVYRTLLIIPWAMPQIVAILAWRGEFHPQFGFINQVLEVIGIGAVGWWSEKIPVFISCCIVNIWLGIPFMMVVFLGGLQSISKSYYEAATIDGAGKWQQFREITLPLLKPTVVPSITLGTIWTFNNINVIYLMSGGNGGNEFADILVSALYKASFTYSRYSFSAAFAIVIFMILFLMTLVWMRLSRVEEEDR